MKKYIYLLFPALLALPVYSGAQTIITVAGAERSGYSGDTGLAVSAQLHWPKAVALSKNGELYIADALNNVVRKVARNGIITTVAGTGYQSGTGRGGYSGDTGPATAARLFNPTGVAVDTANNLYIADKGNHRIRKVDVSGTITTIAGTGVIGYLGDGAAAVMAQLNGPARVAVDTFGNIYIADELNSRIRKINVSGTISTLAGNGIPGYSGDGGAANAAQLYNPADVAVDALGVVYIADTYNNVVRRVDLSGNITTIAGTGVPGWSGDTRPAIVGQLFQPSGVAVDYLGYLYISDLGNERIRKVSPTNIIITLAGNGDGAYGGDGGKAKLASLWFPQGMATDNYGGVYVADQGNNRVRFISSSIFVNTVENTIDRISIYPNPSNGVFRLQIFSTNDENAEIVIFNTLGQMVYELNGRTNTPLEVRPDLPAGQYLLRAQTATGKYTERLIVQ
jgi:sugar lactone lactonase YvrE